MALDIYTRPSAFFKMQSFEAIHPQAGPVSLRAGILSPRYGLENLGVAIDEVLLPVIQKIQPYGDHYNDYGVSSGVLSTKVIDDEQRLVLTLGNNTKLVEGIDPWKTCSEEFSVGTAELMSVDRIWAIGVAAVRKVDDKTGILMPQLPPCDDCRTRLYEHELVGADTRIELVNTVGVRESIDVQGLKIRYGYVQDFSAAA